MTSDHAAIIDPDAGSTYKNEFLAGIEFDVLGKAHDAIERRSAGRGWRPGLREARQRLGGNALRVDHHFRFADRLQQLVGVHGPALKIKVRAAPEQGKANAAVCTLVAELLDVAPARCIVTSGASSRYKKVAVEGIEVLLRGLSMPHSPRGYLGHVWVLESGKGTLCLADPRHGRAETVMELPGFTRGLAFAGRLRGLGALLTSAADGLTGTGERPVSALHTATALAAIRFYSSPSIRRADGWHVSKPLSPPFRALP